MNDSTSLVDSAYDWVLDQITNFHFSVGVPITETKLASQIGISRTPIREALQRLEQQGLLKKTNSGRYTVIAPTKREVNESCDALQILDVYSYKKAAEKISEEDSARLVELAHGMILAAERNDTDAWSRCDNEFHEVIHAVCDNNLVSSMTEHVRLRIHRFWMKAAKAHSRLPSCSSEHMQLAQSLRVRDYLAIEFAVTQHIEHMRNSVLEMVDQLESVFGAELLGQ